MVFITQKESSNRNFDCVKVNIFKYENCIITGKSVSDSDIVAYSKKYDLALLKLRTTDKIDTVAKLLDPNALNKIKLLDNIIIIGCSMSMPPLVTDGQITQFNHEIDNESYWVSNAPIIYGNSGGSVFYHMNGQWYFIGVPARTLKVGASFTHISFFVPLNSVVKWAKADKLNFLFDNSVSPKSCFEDRDNTKD